MSPLQGEIRSTAVTSFYGKEGIRVTTILRFPLSSLQLRATYHQSTVNRSLPVSSSPSLFSSRFKHPIYLADLL